MGGQEGGGAPRLRKEGGWDWDDATKPEGDTLGLGSESFLEEEEEEEDPKGGRGAEGFGFEVKREEEGDPW